MPERYSLKERLMLANQYEILSLLHKDDEVKNQHYRSLQTIFQHGYAGLYNVAENDILSELSVPETNFVMNMLKMYINIYRSTLENGEDQKQLEGEPIYFNGFDINSKNELDYLMLTELLMKDFMNYQILNTMIEEGKFKLHMNELGPSVATLSKMSMRAQYIDDELKDEGRKYYTNAEILDIIHTR